MEGVELIYIAVDKTTVHLKFEFKQGLKVIDVIKASGIWNNHPETQTMAIGIYAQPVELETLLKSGDRIEIYRPLTLDPKEKRRQRAKRITPSPPRERGGQP